MLAVLSLEKLCIALLWEESVSDATKINPSHLHYWLKLNCVYHWFLCRNLNRVVCILLLSTPKNYQFLGNQNPTLYLSQVSPVICHKQICQLPITESVRYNNHHIIVSAVNMPNGVIRYDCIRLQT
jgi:hypothetical protein